MKSAVTNAVHLRDAGLRPASSQGPLHWSTNRSLTARWSFISIKCTYRDVYGRNEDTPTRINASLMSAPPATSCVTTFRLFSSHSHLYWRACREGPDYLYLPNGDNEGIRQCCLDNLTYPLSVLWPVRSESGVRTPISCSHATNCKKQDRPRLTQFHDHLHSCTFTL